MKGILFLGSIFRWPVQKLTVLIAYLFFGCMNNLFAENIGLNFNLIFTATNGSNWYLIYNDQLHCLNYKSAKKELSS